MGGGWAVAVMGGGWVAAAMGVDLAAVMGAG